MNGSEAGPSSSAPVPANSRTLPESGTHEASNFSQPTSGLRRGHSDGSHVARGGTIILGRSSSTSAAAAAAAAGAPVDEGETWQDFLRRAAPQDISSRDPNDPVRQAYFSHRKAKAIEEARKRRRSANSFSGYNRAAPPPPTPHRQHSGSLSLSGIRAMQRGMQGSPRQYQPGPAAERPLPRLPSFDAPRDSPTGEYVVPRWQPDSEVSSCPICGKAFGVFFRRHHCRKCGRVVCAACSPHRITIPRQFIVHPPEDPSLRPNQAQGERPDVVDLTGDDEGTETAQDNENIIQRAGGEERNPALGGGQEVRLCNPCVPDPNPLPPPNYPTGPGTFTSFPAPGDSLEGGTESAEVDQRFNESRHNRARRWDNFVAGMAGSNATMAPIGLRSPYGSAPTRSSGSYFPQPSPHAAYYNHPAYASQQPHIPPHPRHRSHASTSYLPPRRHHSLHHAPLPPTPLPPPPPLREEDECPICHGELPPKGPNGEETAREQHVAECIEGHFSSSAPRNSQPHPSTAIQAAVNASAARPQDAGSSSGVTPSQIPLPLTPTQPFRPTAEKLFSTTKGASPHDWYGSVPCVGEGLRWR